MIGYDIELSSEILFRGLAFWLGLKTEDALVGLSKSTSFPVIELTDKELAGSIQVTSNGWSVIYAIVGFCFYAVLQNFTAVIVEGLVIVSDTFFPVLDFPINGDYSEPVSAFVLSNLMLAFLPFTIPFIILSTALLTSDRV